MTQQTNDTAPHATDTRKDWQAPTLEVLPVEETAINATVGNDGRGPTTGS